MEAEKHRLTISRKTLPGRAAPETTRVVEVDFQEFCRLLVSRRILHRGSSRDDDRQVLLDPVNDVRYEADTSIR